MIYQRAFHRTENNICLSRITFARHVCNVITQTRRLTLCQKYLKNEIRYRCHFGVGSIICVMIYGFLRIHLRTYTIIPNSMCKYHPMVIEMCLTLKTFLYTNKLNQSSLCHEPLKLPAVNEKNLNSVWSKIV